MTQSPASTNRERRVVVTGLGAITPLGNDVCETWDAVIAGRSGISWLSRFDASDFPQAIAGEVHNFVVATRLPAKMIRHTDRSVHLGASAALEALSDAGLADTELGPDAGVVFGSSLGGQGLRETQNAVLRQHGPRRVSPFMLPNILPDAASGHLAILTGAKGPNMAILSASATGASAIGEAAEIILRGDAELMIAGAGEAPLTPVLYAALAAMHALAQANDYPAQACRPFDLNRTGFVPSEGAAAVILESAEHAKARGARSYAELSGYGSGNDAFDIVASEPTGRGAAIAMRTALRKAGIGPQQVSYLNAHGTASRMNDRVETTAIKQVFGANAYRLAISSTKSTTGHLMGAAGALEAVLSILSLYHGILPPTMNYESPDPECDLDYIPNKARLTKDVDAVLSHSVGLGGHNASLVFGRA